MELANSLIVSNLKVARNTTKFLVFRQQGVWRNEAMDPQVARNSERILGGRKYGVWRNEAMNPQVARNTRRILGRMEYGHSRNGRWHSVMCTESSSVCTASLQRSLSSSSSAMQLHCITLVTQLKWNASNQLLSQLGKLLLFLINNYYCTISWYFVSYTWIIQIQRWLLYNLHTIIRFIEVFSSTCLPVGLSNNYKLFLLFFDSRSEYAIVNKLFALSAIVVPVRCYGIET